jgi:prepilin-type N-terminal cleavage/methylation domain-containing protein
MTDQGLRWRPDSRAFTLIEFVAVLALLSLLAAALIPTIIGRVDHAARTKERADLRAIADSSIQHILRNKVIPDHTTWASAVAGQMSFPVSAITTNSRGYARAFLIDTNLSIGGAGLPYTNAPNGNGRPVSVRFMIVSSLARALPVSSGVPSSTEFNAIWDTPDDAKPSTWTAWPGSGDDVHIRRFNLEPLFHQLILINHDRTRLGMFSIDSTNTFPVPTDGLGTNGYYFDGTVVGLHNENGVVQTRYLLKRSISFIFESGAWEGQVSGGQTLDPLAGNFAAQASNFYLSPSNPGAQSGASVFSALVAMYTFMFDYTLWANECPHFDNHGTSTSPEYQILYEVGGPSQNLDTFSGTTGLLKKP